MNCPLCIDTSLDVTFHSGIELDICPRCQGVWLDRGELQRLASDARESAESRSGPSNHGSRRGADRDESQDWHDSDDRGSRAGKGSSEKKSSKKKRKKTFAERLGDVFEEIIDL